MVMGCHVCVTAERPQGGGESAVERSSQDHPNGLL